MNDLALSQGDYRAVHQYIDRALALPAIQIETIILFGSKARGDSSPESDMDLMIILDDAALPQQEPLYALTFDVLLESGVYISTQVMSADLFRQLPIRRPLFYANLIRDGVLLYTRPDVSLPQFSKRMELKIAA
jgi:predicted nucleotidyltransferase